MMPNRATCREKPDRSVNITAHSSPNRSQIRRSIAATSASACMRSSTSFHNRDELPLRSLPMRPSVRDNRRMEGDRERWNAKWRERAGELELPASFLSEHAYLLPTTGKALDLAGGAGRNAIWLARRGFEVTLVDIS